MKKNLSKRRLSTLRNLPQTPLPENKLFYRYESRFKFDTQGRNLSDLEIFLRTYFAIKETKTGFWISDELNCNYSEIKWVSKESVKRFAYPTEEEALENFTIRNQNRVRILSEQLRISKMNVLNAQKLKSTQIVPELNL